MKKLFALLICFLFLVTSCVSLKVNIKEGYHKLDTYSDSYKVGIGRTMLTPHPGHSMGGYGNELGKISRGWWNHLYSTAYYIEDSQGNYLIMVSTDLWSMSMGLVDQVMENLHESDNILHKIARENIVLSATHTHNSPGNMSSSWGYNLGSSALPGFDKRLFNFLSHQITLSIKEAINTKEAAYINFKEVSYQEYQGTEASRHS